MMAGRDKDGNGAAAAIVPVLFGCIAGRTAKQPGEHSLRRLLIHVATHEHVESAVPCTHCCWLAMATYDSA